MTSVGTAVLAALCALAFATILSRRTTLTAKPMPDRWHVRATPITGGVAIFAGLLVALQPAIFARAIDSRYLPVVLGIAGAFAVGLVDDVRTLRPRVKLAGQALVAVGAVALGLVPAWLPWWAGAPIAVLVLVAGMNSVNLLDHIDGLAAGTAMISASCLALIAGGVGGFGSSVLPAAIAGACAGYLPLNFWPRRSALIFMGDSGSHLLGFGLGGVALLSNGGGVSSVVSAVAVPALVLAVPVLDTLLVTVVRWVEGRPISQGGRDHSSHRLVYGGLGPQAAVLVLLTISAACGGTGVLLASVDDPMLVSVGAGVALAFLIAFGSRLAMLQEGGAAKVVRLRRAVPPAGEERDASSR